MSQQIQLKLAKPATAVALGIFSACAACVCWCMRFCLLGRGALVLLGPLCLGQQPLAGPWRKLSGTWHTCTTSNTPFSGVKHKLCTVLPNFGGLNPRTPSRTDLSCGMQSQGWGGGSKAGTPNELKAKARPTKEKGKQNNTLLYLCQHRISKTTRNDTCGIRTHAGRPHRLSRPTP